MHPFLDYILKANLLLIFFGLFYLIFLKRETFYQLNRWYFIGSIIVSITAPLVTFTKTVLVEPIPVDFFVSDNQTSVIDEVVAEPSFLETINLQQISVYLILIISSILIIRKIYAVVKLYRSIKKLPSLGASNIKITADNKTVYSFYQWIVVPENFFQWQNHKMILDHESIHLNQKHTFDLILIELVVAVFWFNPLVKVMQRAINTNLEFIVDQKMIETTESVLYQKNLLQFQTQHEIQFVNSYNASEIKNRILQLNSKKSTNMKKLKFLLATPVLLAFFALFQIETVAQVKESKNLEKRRTDKPKLIEKESENNKKLNKNQLLKKEKDFFMLLDTVEKDLDVLKNDRKTFDKVASKFPIVIDGVLMNKKELKNFDTSKIKSVHIDAGNPKKGTIVNLSTNDDDNSGSRMFTFKIADDNTDKPSNKILINGKESTEEELKNHINSINNKKEPLRLTNSIYNNSNVYVLKSNPNSQYRTVEETYFISKNGDAPNNKRTVYKDVNGKILKVEDSNDELPVVESNKFVTSNIVYVVDGDIIMEDNFRKINPNDIENITILKDQKSKEKYSATTKAKKEVSIQQKTQALKARELAIKKRNEVAGERKEIVKERKKEMERLKQIRKDLKTVTSIFNDVKKIKNTEDENFKITSVRASITREDGTKVELSEVY